MKADPSYWENDSSQCIHCKIRLSVGSLRSGFCPNCYKRQFFPKTKRFDKEEPDLKVKFLGYVDRPIKLGRLRSNSFKITIRDLRKKELNNVLKRVESIKKFGVPNYFDSQRFGSVFDDEFIGKLLILKEYEEAVRIYLTYFSEYEKDIIKEEKAMIEDNWKRLDKIDITTQSLAVIVEEYLKTKSWLSAYRRIPSNIRGIMISAYQSYLWNECVKETLIRTIGKTKLYGVSYKLGELLFYHELSDSEAEKLPKKFNKISDELHPEGQEKEIISDLLKKEGITIPDFKIKKETGNFFKTQGRSLLLKPARFVISKPEKDELNDDAFKLRISFVLLKGSYATVLIKRLFDEN